MIKINQNIPSSSPHSSGVFCLWDFGRLSPNAPKRSAGEYVI